MNIADILNVIHVMIIMLVVFNVWCVFGFVLSGLITSQEQTYGERFISSIAWIWLVAVAIHELIHDTLKKH